MAKKGKLVRSASSKAQFKAYNLENRYTKNKYHKMVRAYMKQPHNEQLRIKIVELHTKIIKYTRNRKSFGHICKGLYNSLGFEKNQPNEFMLKGKAPIHTYYAGANIFAFNNSVPNTGKSMRTQLEELGFKWTGYGKRKYKKTSR